MSKVMVMDHPLIRHKIGLIRKKETGTKDFRETISEIAMMICYEGPDIWSWQMCRLRLPSAAQQ